MKAALRQQTENEQRVAEEYLSSLSDLNCNSKPLINMLTMLAEENIEYASVIVKVVEQHIAKVHPDFKLPILYLIDSIVKNVKSTYVQLFSQCIVNIFCGVFEKVNEKIRERMYALRQTWNEVFSAQKLYALDVKVKRMDVNWPITAKQPQPSIHVNPNFLKTVSVTQAIPTDMEEILHVKTRELLELKKKKLELELEATKKHLEEQEKQLSKATESVIPPVEATVATSALPPTIRPKMAQQIMPQNMIPAGLLLPHPSASSIRPGMYQQFRNPRPPQQTHIAPSALMNLPQTYPMNNVKTKVHPVTPSLLNSVRQRDPRLARQQQQQQQQQQMHHSPQSVRGPHGNLQLTEDNRNETSNLVRPVGTSYMKSQSIPNRNGSGNVMSGSGPTFEGKSPNRHSSSTRSSGRSSGKSSSRDRERDRKTNDDKNSSTPSASTSVDRRKTGAVTNSSKPKCDDKDAFEIVPLSSAFKRKSSSPASSPNKTKESKRSSKFRGNVRSKNRSRSPSPELPSKDVDLRPQGSPDKRFKLSTSSPSRKADTEKEIKSEEANTKDLEKTPKTEKKSIVDVDEILEKMPMLSSKDVDLRQFTSSSVLTSINQAIVTSETSAIVATSSPKVSFKIQKPFNKLEKSTDNLSTVAAKDVVSVVKKEEEQPISTSEEKPDPNVAIASNKHTPEAMLVNTNESDDIETKKRSLVTLEEEEPLPKKSKQAVFDPLFGSQDVDLRTVMPPQILSVQSQTSNAIMIPPPPPVISDNQDNENAEASEEQKEVKVSNKAVPQNVLNKSSLDDVRAKLAKAAKYNKIGKPDKSSKEATQRLKTAELDVNEDSQEANDEKIRTIISQAQELLDSKSINQEQYKNLVQTVMSINETKKLKEAKKRESLVLSKNNHANDEDIADNERMAARDAVLKKKIPKLPKDQITTAENKSVERHPNDSTAEGSLAYQDANSNDGNTAFKSKIVKEKRNKPSKWGDRMEVQQMHNHPVASSTDGNMNQKTWHLGPMQPTAFNKRPGGFNIRAPHPPLPPIPNLNLRLPQIALPSPWQIGANVAAPFPNPVPLLRSSVPPPPQPPAVGLPAIPAPPVIPKPCNSIDNPQADMVRSITIDGRAKEIRIYDQIAIVFMELDQPREIGFQAGQRSIIIDNMEPIALKFNDDFKQITIEDEVHKIRFGFPSRELYIDDDWYEIYFGGPPVTIPLKNKLHVLKAEGPPPQVNIGPLRRDLVVGKINMIVDAHIVIPVFLDAKIQTFRLGENEHTIQFADNLLTILLDGQVFQVEYGGLPKSISLGNVKYFIRFGALPQGVLPGKVLIKGMSFINTEPPNDIEEPIAPAKVENNIQDTDKNTTCSESDNIKQEDNSAAPTLSTIPAMPPPSQSMINIDELFQKLVSSGILGPTATLSAVKTDMDKDKMTKTNNQTSSLSADSKPSADENILEKIIPVDLSKPETIKTRQSAIVATLFSGMQCSSCGVRFPPEQTIKYSQHLDWHFRQNRRERDSTRKAHSRKWYYDLSDWVQYEEIEDLEEREKNFFENQQTDLESVDDVSNQRSSNSPLPSCPAKSDDVNRTCDMCQEKFEQFYNEELEEWHLRSAMRVDDKIYHPLCYEDYKASLKPQPETIKDDPKENNDAAVIIADDDNAVDIEIKMEEANKEDDKHSVTIDDDEDDDVIVLPNEEPSVTEIDDDDDEYVPVNVTREEMGTNDEIKSSDVIKEKDLNDTTESDVEIQEPNIPFTDLDTYEEKVLPEIDETSQPSLMNVKIKEEPKDDEDEDDGFEDVGTVLIRADDEISIQSSEGTQPHTIVSSTSAMSPCDGERSPSATSHHETLDSVEEVNKSLDGTTNLDTEDDHNLSAAGQAPAIPVTNLVNKIKINITKNMISTNIVTPSTTTTTTSSLNSNELNSVSNNSTMKTTSTISTIPVLCGGVSGTAKTSLSVQSGNPSSSSTYKDNDSSSGISAISVIGSNMNVSNISVIGSSVYGSTSRYHHHSNRIQPQASSSLLQQTVTTANVAPAKTTEPLPPAEEVIEYELKPALKNVTLKKTKRIECGVETSGLCSIM